MTFQTVPPINQVYGGSFGANVLHDLHALRGVENLKPDDIAGLIIIEDDTGLVFIAFFDGRSPKKHAKRIHCWIVGDFHFD